MKGISLLVPALAGLLALAGCSTSSKSPGQASTVAATQSHFANCGTNRVHYATAGRGRDAIVLVHCWAGNGSFWREQVPALAGRARLVIVDLPGHGLSDRPHTGYTMDFFAGAVLAVMRDAKIDRATLIGHSMGVAVICRVYSQAPAKVAALVSVDGMLRRPEIPAEQAAEFIKPFHEAGYRDHTTRFIGSMFPIPGTEAIRDRVLADILNTPQHVMSGAMDGMFGASQPDWDLKRVPVPVLVLNAANPMWNDDYRAYVRGLSPKTEYRAFEGVGHWLMLEKPAEFNAAFVQMLEQFELVRR